MRSPAHHAPPLRDSVAMLERAVGYARVSLQSVTPGTLHHRTPCREWDLAALLDHMADSLDALIDAADLGYVAVHPPAGPPSPVPVVEHLRVKACHLLGSWVARSRDGRVMVGDLPLAGSLLACTGALEVTVHGWDVARATGLDHPVPPPLALDLLSWTELLVTDTDRPHRFASPVAVPPEADPATRLLAVTGRPST